VLIFTHPIKREQIKCGYFHLPYKKGEIMCWFFHPPFKKGENKGRLFSLFSPTLEKGGKESKVIFTHPTKRGKIVFGYFHISYKKKTAK